MTDRWTAETEELVARAVYGRRTGTNVDGFTDWDWDNAPLSADARRAWRTRAAGVLTALADAGLLLPPGGETRRQRGRGVATAGYERMATWWPDGSIHYGPWVAVSET